MQEQKYQAVMAVLSDGRSVSEVAAQWGVSRQSVHAWLRRYEDGGHNIDVWVTDQVLQFHDSDQLLRTKKRTHRGGESQTSPCPRWTTI